MRLKNLILALALTLCVVAFVFWTSTEFSTRAMDPEFLPYRGRALLIFLLQIVVAVCPGLCGTILAVFAYISLKDTDSHEGKYADKVWLPAITGGVHIVCVEGKFVKVKMSKSGRIERVLGECPDPSKAEKPEWEETKGYWVELVRIRDIE